MKNVNTDDLYYIKFHTEKFVYRTWPDLIQHRDIVYCALCVNKNKTDTASSGLVMCQSYVLIAIAEYWWRVVSKHKISENHKNKGHVNMKGFAVLVYWCISVVSHW